MVLSGNRVNEGTNLAEHQFVISRIAREVQDSKIHVTVVVVQ